MKRRVIGAIGAIVLLALAVPALGNMNFIPNTYGLSARSMGMGNSLTASRYDLGMAFYNPAALGMLDHSAAGLGYLFAQPRFDSEIDGEKMPDFDTANEIVVVDLVISLKNILTHGKRGMGLGVSLTLDDNGATFVDFRDHRSKQGQYLRYGTSSATILTGLGVEIMPWLMLGAGAIVQMEAEVQMQVNTDLEGNSNNESFDQLASTVLTPTAGVLVPWKDWTFGLTWRAESKGQIGPIDADTLAEVGGSELASLPLSISFRDSFIPMQLAGGAQYMVLDGLLLSLDLTWMQWSRFIEFSEEEDSARDDIKFDFVDTFVPRLGAEFVLFEKHALRAGYSYDMTPVKGIGTYKPYEDLNVVGFVILDNDKHVASLGYGYTLEIPKMITYPVQFDLGMQMQYLAPRTAETSDGVKYKSEGILFGGMFNVSLGF